jgi:integrase
MTIKFNTLTRANIRNLALKQKLQEHGIEFERLPNGDGCWRISIMVDGQRIHRVVGKESDGTTRQHAEDLIAKLRTEARDDRLNLPKGRKLTFSFKEAAEKYLEKQISTRAKNLKSKIYQLRLHLIPFLNGKPIDKISDTDIEEYKNHRLEKGVCEGTVNRELAVLSHFFTKALEWKWLNHRPTTVKKFKEDQSRKTYLTVEQIDRLLSAAKQDESKYIYPFIAIGLETGMRLTEILSIRLEDIELDIQRIFIPQAKAGKRPQPITAHLVSVLTPYVQKAQPNQIWLFPSEKSTTGHSVNIRKPFRRVVAAAGLNVSEVVRHTLRHTAITHLVQAGVDLPTVKRISGHKTLKMVEQYSHQNGNHIQAAMDKLDQRYRANQDKENVTVPSS